MGATAFLLLFVLGLLLTIAGGITGLVEAFRVSTVWGLLYLLVPFAALVFIIKFWNRKWTRNSLFMWLGGLAMLLLSGLSSGFLLTRKQLASTQESEPSLNGVPLPSDQKLPASEPAGDQAFAEPMVPAAPDLTPIASAELIQSTDPDERVQQVEKSRPDPYAALPIPPAPQVIEPPTVTPRPTPPAVTPTPPRNSSGGSGNGSNAGKPGGSGSSGSNNQNGSGNNAGGSTAPPQLPPATSLASAVSVTGVATIGQETYAIVKAPQEDTSRYVKVGQRLSNGQVLVKRIELKGGSEPVVILEENGIEVPRPVGGSVEPTDGKSTAMAASTSSQPPISIEDYLIQ